MTRRELMVEAGRWGLACAALSIAGSPRHASAADGQPNRATLAPGDLLWPKPLGTVVPYDATVNPATQQATWEAERDAYVQAVRAQPAPVAEEADAVAALSSMSFQEFQIQYLLDQSSSSVTPF